MEFIRQAMAGDASRIAEIIVTNYRINFYPFFRNDEFYFGELNVADTAAEYTEGSEALRNTYVYDDGIIKGIIRINGSEIEKLYIEPQFQSQGIGAQLLRFAVSEKGTDTLWALEYNTRGIAFYKRNGFELTGEKMIEDEWIPLLKMSRKPSSAKEDTGEYFTVLNESHLPQMAELYKNAFGGEPWNDDWSDEKQLMAYMKDISCSFNSLNFGLFSGGKLIALSVGMIKHWWMGTNYNVEEFCVSPDMQGKNIGSRFMGMIEEYVRDMGLAGIFLQTDSDKPSYNFYLKNGFTELDAHVSFYKRIMHDA